MARPKQDTPTAGELEVLRVLWEKGACTVREVLDEVNKIRPRAYTSVMTLLNIMADKGLVEREPEGRAFRYRARRSREKTLGKIVSDVLGRAFAGSTSQLVAQLLRESHPSPEELAEIRRAINEYSKELNK
ncbi:MAG: BlaI/MecI/CopY family transcriptional regulator [Verrucomicrobiae bacterium]|nr:BlaI/MecI/CopY family transcriptional regulator [Verrucomicrobiae bacterium]